MIEPPKGVLIIVKKFVLASTIERCVIKRCGLFGSRATTLRIIGNIRARIDQRGDFGNIAEPETYWELELTWRCVRRLLRWRGAHQLLDWRLAREEDAAQKPKARPSYAWKPKRPSTELPIDGNVAESAEREFRRLRAWGVHGWTAPSIKGHLAVWGCRDGDAQCHLSAAEWETVEAYNEPQYGWEGEFDWHDLPRAHRKQREADTAHRHGQNPAG